jgi:hypothetical protein
MRIRLIRKLAECIDGVDLSECNVGDVLEVSRREGELLIAEGWGTLLPERRASDKRHASPSPLIAQAADTKRKKRRRRERQRDG